MRPKASLLIEGAGQVITDPDRGDLGVLKGGIVAMGGDRVVWVGPEGEMARHVDTTGAQRLDARGGVVLPGLVDCHTHLVFAGTREQEFHERNRGVSYQEIARRGGGILSTVRAVRQASMEELLSLARPRLHRMLAMGITTVEVKSGYGLTLEAERKLLRVTAMLGRESPVRLVPTFLGAHTVPYEARGDRAAHVRDIIERWIPAVAEEGLARFCDVFCEEGAFGLEESRRVLEAGLRWGLRPKVHADQLSGSGGAELAAEVGAVSADHLEHVSPAGIAALARAGVVAVLLPGCNFFLNQAVSAPARELLEAGVRVALSTDFNPGSCATEALPLIVTMGCIRLGLGPEEAIRAVTTHAARALALDPEEAGTLLPGARGDAVVLDVPSYAAWPYHFGVNHTLATVAGGEVVYRGWGPS